MSIRIHTGRLFFQPFVIVLNIVSLYERVGGVHLIKVIFCYNRLLEYLPLIQQKDKNISPRINR